MKTLYLIPARGGSKGIPKKNIKLLDGKPLIYYSIDIARKFAADKDICVSSDNDEIIDVVEKYGLAVPFKRPDHLSEDQSGSNEVLQHVITFFKNQGREYDNIMLLQPTSPFRTPKHIREILSCYEDDLD
ncbi:MAG: acylneuraminate cytidylyltransferase family protein, partial [Pedobacter sp.]|uniref:acylneuraminate cytidylyltransferase family protein n=1 Tax=Pedobacter sp. TaxID=1411316 RepID=UPI0035628982